MAQMYINYGSFDGWAAQLDAKNNRLLEDLHSIQATINSLSGEWESNSATTIRNKITNMEPRFQQYYEVVSNYSKFLRNSAAEYRALEQTNTSLADEFV